MQNNKRKAVFWSCIVVFFVCSVFLIGWGVHKKSRSEEYEELKEEVQQPVEEIETEEPVVIPINFEELKNRNEDIYAWIQIPGTVVDYPMLQHPTDDAYYLNHTAYKEYGLPGCIYTEPSYNTTDFTDRNTLIYGHNMNDGSMFGDLSYYMDSAYMQEHQEILIYTPEHIYTYRVFAAITYDDRHIMYSFDFSSESGLQAFLDSISSVRNMQSYIDESIEVTAQDRIITLSTCTTRSAQRFLVGAVLVEEQ